MSKLKGKDLIEYRREVQAVFQDPYEVYNPFYRVRHIFDLVIDRFKLAKSKSEARQLVEDALNVVGMRGEDLLDKYPHQLSGGQRQRMMVARAFLLKPRLIVADEPVSMVDASLRATILDIMLRMRDQYNISFLYITHDLSTAYQIGDQIFILYQGAIAECGATSKVIEAPKHPYVQFTFTVVEWLPVFIDQAACRVITDSFNFCIKHKSLGVNAYVIMPTHLHALLFDIQFNSDRLKHTLDDMRKFTGRHAGGACGSPSTKDLW